MPGLRCGLADFYKAYRRGWRRSWRLLTGTFQVVLGLAAVTGIVFALLNIPDVEDIALRTFLWVLVIAFLLFVAAVLGLTPYWGQKAIAKRP